MRRFRAGTGFARPGRMTNSSSLWAVPVGLGSVLFYVTTGLAQNPGAADTTNAAPPAPADSSAPAAAVTAENTASTAPTDASASATPADTQASASAPDPGRSAAEPTTQKPLGPASNAEQRRPVGNTEAAAGIVESEKPDGRTHDGFYLRLALGAGTGTTEFGDAPGELSYAIETTGWLDVMMGGTPGPGLAVGGGMWMGGFDTSEWRGENSDRGTVAIFAMGPFVDYFPDPREGFHFGATVGLGGLSIDAEPFSNSNERTATGGALGAWIGYDFWVSREFSAGLAARYLGVRVKHPEGDWQGAADTFGLSLTGLYH
jgi:hypothetical protein